MAGEALSAMAVVKAFGVRAARGRPRARRQRAADGGRRRHRAPAGRLRRAGRLVRAIGTALVIVVGVMRVAAGALSPGELLVFVSYTRKAYNPLKSLARESTKVAATMAKADRIAEILAADDVLEDGPGAYRGGRAGGDVALERVSFAYDARAARPARRLAADPGRRVRRPRRPVRRGQVDARRARRPLPRPDRGPRADRRARRARLRAGVAARAGRDPAPGHGAVHRHRARQHRLRLGGERRRDRRRRPRRRRRTSSSASCRDGYDTELGPQGAGLSGGQRQRIGIARTLLRDPPILLLDEPTTALDAASEAQLLDGLRTLMRGRTTILVSHSPRLTRMADRVVRLDADGRRDRCDAATRARSTRRCRSSSGCSTRTRWPRCSTARSRRRSARSRSAASSTSPASSSPCTTAPVARRATPSPPASPASTSPSGRGGRGTPSARGGSPAARPPDPLSYDDELGTLVTWLPFDPRLPALGEPGDELGAAARRGRPASRAASATSRAAAPCCASAASCSRRTAASASSRPRSPACRRRRTARCRPPPSRAPCPSCA